MEDNHSHSLDFQLTFDSTLEPGFVTQTITAGQNAELQVTFYNQGPTVAVNVPFKIVYVNTMTVVKRPIYCGPSIKVNSSVFVISFRATLCTLSRALFQQLLTRPLWLVVS